MPTCRRAAGSVCPLPSTATATATAMGIRRVRACVRGRAWRVHWQRPSCLHAGRKPRGDANGHEQVADRRTDASRQAGGVRGAFARTDAATPTGVAKGKHSLIAEMIAGTQFTL